MNQQLEKKILCSICNKSFKNLGQHLRAHKISSDEYRRRYGETSYQRMIINKINKLFVSERSKWVCGYYINKGDQLTGGYRTYDIRKIQNSYSIFVKFS